MKHLLCEGKAFVKHLLCEALGQLFCTFIIPALEILCGLNATAETQKDETVQSHARVETSWNRGLCSPVPLRALTPTMPTPVLTVFVGKDSGYTARLLT